MREQTQPLFSAADLKKLLVPLIAEQFLAVMVGMADTIMVSSVGEAAVSGISLVDQINLLLVQVFAAMATGGAVVASQYLGRRDRSSAVASAKQLFYVTLGLSVLISVPCLLMNAAMLRWIYGSIEPAVMQSAKTYFWLSALSYPFIAVYNAGAALFRSMGNSKVSLIASLIMNVLNIIGNVLLIYGARWGVAGAAISSLLARAAAAVMVVLLLLNRERPIYFERLLCPCWNPQIVMGILRVGIPTGLENGMFQIGKLLVAGLITSYGTAAIAANAVCNNILSFNNIPGSAIGLAAVTVVGRCMGARSPVQARRYTRMLLLLAYGAIAAVAAVIYLAAPFLAGFYEMSEETTQMALQVIQVVSVGSALFWAPAFMLPQALRAAGDARFTMLVSMFSMWLFRIGLSIVLGSWLGMGLLGVWLAMVVDWVARSVFFLVRLAGSRWLQKRVIE